MTPVWLAFVLGAFILSGVSVPMLIELVSINGGCEKTTFLVTLPGAVGMIFCIFANWGQRKEGTIHWPGIVGIALLEFFSQVLNLTGLIYAGSAVFTVVYASVTMYTAVFSYLLLHRHINRWQWVGVLTVMLGLALASIGAEADGPAVMIGVLMILAGSMSHSLTYIISEYLLIDTPDPVAPELLSTLIGLVATALNLIWQIAYTIPRFQSKVIDEIALHRGSSSEVLSAYVLIVIASTVHALCFFRLLGSVGSTSTGVCKGVQSVVVFVASHFAYCAVQKSQCFTLFKGVSLVTVVAGVFIYSSNSTSSNSNSNSNNISDALTDDINAEVEIEFGSKMGPSAAATHALLYSRIPSEVEQSTAAAVAVAATATTALPSNTERLLENIALLPTASATTANNFTSSGR